MKKTILSATLTAIGVAPSLALAQSNVTIYGAIRTAVESISATGSTNSANDLYARIRVTDNDSALGFRGEEDLGNGLKAFFLIENSINPSDGGSTWSSRNAGAGLRGGFGEVLFGRWDTYNNTHEAIADTVGGVAGQASKVRAVITKLNSQEVGGRFNNTIQYTTPSLSGFSGRLQYSAGNSSEAKSATRDDEHVWSAYLQYVNGPVGLQYAYTKQTERNLVDNHKVVGNKLVGSYSFMNATRLGLGWERIDFDNHAAGNLLTAGTFNTHRDAYFATLSHSFGSHSIFGTYAVAKDAKGSSTLAGSNTGAKYYQLTYSYMFSKRTNVHATYARVDNKAVATYDLHSSGALGSVGAGSNPTSVQFGVVHRF